MKPPVIYWFRHDLRTEDLPGLAAAAATDQPVLCCYILDDDSPGQWAAGGASRWWLHHSLLALSQQLADAGGQLILLRGPARDVLPELVQRHGATGVYCSRLYEPWADALECDLHAALSDREVAFKRYPGALLYQPEAVHTQSGSPFKVFTPFWRACRAGPEPNAPVAAPKMRFAKPGPNDGLTLEELSLLPQKPDWASHWDGLWQPGSEGAADSLQRFLKGPVRNYDEARNHPARAATSRLSPHLHFGELSPRQLWHTVRAHCARHPELAGQEEKFLSELGWREFSHHLLYHFPYITHSPFKENFGRFPWLGGDDALRAWQRGLTGYPIVDAGMRELWHTGYMHNRVRMITASFLTKHLLIPWQAGQRWFHDTLVDADLANNSCGWQWVAGSGADAAPYFRIFNPTLQGEKFDAAGEYVKQWVPELAALPAKYLHAPERAPQSVLETAGVILGEDYPHPIVDHKAAREAALAAYASLKTD
jgi:deoxyribodipyrimidine photo-lyase